MRPYATALCLALLFIALSGCASHGTEHFACSRVFYATDRQWTGQKGEYYGHGRTQISFGICDVGILTNDRPGADRVTHVTLPATMRAGMLGPPQELHGDDIVATLRHQVDSTDKTILVFVHGYNVPFVEAAADAAQLSYDLGLSGVPVLFSWPSEGDLLGYMADEDTSIWAAPHLTHLLRQIRLAAPDATIHIIAHSMGGRVVSNALRDFPSGERPAKKPLLGQVIFAAPDIDADIFKDTVMPLIRNLAQHYTLYASSNDKALSFSHWLHHHARAGQAGNELTIDDHQPQIFQTVDASRADTSGLGHSYYDDPKLDEVARDIQALMHPGLPRVAVQKARDWVMPGSQ